MAFKIFAGDSLRKVSQKSGLHPWFWFWSCCPKKRPLMLWIPLETQTSRAELLQTEYLWHLRWGEVVMEMAVDQVIDNEIDKEAMARWAMRWPRRHQGGDKGSELVGELILVKVEVDVVVPPWWLWRWCWWRSFTDKSTLSHQLCCSSDVLTISLLTWVLVQKDWERWESESIGN